MKKKSSSKGKNNNKSAGTKKNMIFEKSPNTSTLPKKESMKSPQPTILKKAAVDLKPRVSKYPLKDAPKHSI